MFCINSTFFFTKDYFGSILFKSVSADFLPNHRVWFLTLHAKLLLSSQQVLDAAYQPQHPVWITHRCTRSYSFLFVLLIQA